MNVIHSLITPIKDFFFLTTCFHCGEYLQEDENRMCARCWSSLTPVRRDDFTFTANMERFREGGVIDDFFPLYYFEKGKALQSLAHSLKYEEITSFGRELGERIGILLQRAGITADALVPVPLNKRKQRERGYNQSEYIADGIFRVTGIPVLLQAVQRVKYTTTQTQLNAEQRRENIANAFAVNERMKKSIHNCTLIIVDDVVTTGSTIQEVGKVLKQAGANKVIAASAGLAKLGDDS